MFVINFHIHMDTYVIIISVHYILQLIYNESVQTYQFPTTSHFCNISIKNRIHNIARSHNTPGQRTHPQLNNRLLSDRSQIEFVLDRLWSEWSF